MICPLRVIEGLRIGHLNLVILFVLTSMMLEFQLRSSWIEHVVLASRIFWLVTSRLLAAASLIPTSTSTTPMSLLSWLWGTAVVACHCGGWVNMIHMMNHCLSYLRQLRPNSLLKMFNGTAKEIFCWSMFSKSILLFCNSNPMDLARRWLILLKVTLSLLLMGHLVQTKLQVLN